MTKARPRYKILVVLGPTASGKTRLGVALAKRFQGEIVSVDSRQTYRYLDVGTGKDREEYGTIPVHGLDLVDPLANPEAEFDLMSYLRFFRDCLDHLHRQGRLPIAVGGSGLYLDAILFQYQLDEVPRNEALRSQWRETPLAALVASLKEIHPHLHNQTDLTVRPRVVRALEIALSPNRQAFEWTFDLDPFVIGTRVAPERLRQRINDRLRERLRHGLIEEAHDLRHQGVPLEKFRFWGLEYAFLADYLEGRLSRNDLTQKLGSAIAQFAKRQRTWFRRMERKGLHIHWVDPEGPWPSALNQQLSEWLAAP
jgi:tRNA dimethylallyltransferase